MSDPLSIAASVASLIALAGTTSKSFYQFFRSIYDAPATSRDLASALYSLNIALSQIQGTLLHPEFVAAADDELSESLLRCLMSCTAVFDQVSSQVEKSGLALDNQKNPQKAWESVKASFNEGQMKDCLRRIESEKTTLLLTIDIFSARLDAAIMAKMHEIKALVQGTDQKIDRHLKDVRVLLEWAVRKNRSLSKESLSSPEESIETTAIGLSSAYQQNDITNIFQSPGSVLSLKLENLEDDFIGAVWESEPDSRVPLRRVVSQIQMQFPPNDTEGFDRTFNDTMSSDVLLSPTQRPERLAILESVWSTLSRLSIQDSSYDDNTAWRAAWSRFYDLHPEITKTEASTLCDFQKLTLAALKESMRARFIYVDDLRFILDSFNSVTQHWVSEDAAKDDRDVRNALTTMYQVVISYYVWVMRVMKKRKNPLQNFKGALIDQTLNRKYHKEALASSVEAVRCAQANFASKTTHLMQRQQLAMQETMAAQLHMLVEQQRSQPLPLTAAPKTVVPSTLSGQGAHSKCETTPEANTIPEYESHPKDIPSGPERSGQDAGARNEQHRRLQAMRSAKASQGIEP